MTLLFIELLLEVLGLEMLGLEMLGFVSVVWWMDGDTQMGSSSVLLTFEHQFHCVCQNSYRSSHPHASISMEDCREQR